ncbi:MAG TPA: hypothetical protein VL068_09230 [Microthrixaceae bacterium]|nr:hypothetical protein [Microthrixaceae bacterium]
MSDEDLRRTGPPALSEERHSALRATFMTEVRADRDAASVASNIETLSGSRGRKLLGAAAARRGGRGQRRGARRTVGVAVAAICVVATTTVAAAAVVSVMRPDPKEAATVINKSTEQVQWHNEGWRPELQAELVSCVADPGDTPSEFEAYASDFPLSDAIDPGDYERACSSKALELSAQATGSTTTGYTLCASGAGQIPGRVVLLDGSTCDGSGLRSMTGTDLTALNSARHSEVALLAFPQDCPTAAEAEAWVQQRIADLTIPLSLATTAGPGMTSSTVTTAGTAGRPCYRGFVDWNSSTVAIDTFSVPD